MSIPKAFVSYVKAAWLADLPFDEFLRLSQREIDLANAIYSNLDNDYYATVNIAGYGKQDFVMKSDKLDIRKQNNA